jgi:unspecific monooxygenase
LLFGNVMEFEKDPVGWLAQTRRTYGDVVRLDSGAVVVHHPDVVQKVLAVTNTAVVFDNTMLAEPRMQRQHELPANLGEWMGTRRDTRRGLQRTLIVEHLDRIGGTLRAKVAGQADQELNLRDTAERLTAHAVTDFCLGADAPIDDVVDAAQRLSWVSIDMIEHDRSSRPWRRRPSNRIARQAELVEVLTGRAEKRRRNGPPGHSRDLLDLLLYEQSCTDSQAATIIRVILGSASGSPGTALSWSLLRLHEHPDVAAAVRAEVAALGYDPLRPAAQPEGPDGAQLPTDALPYTTAVVKEVLRLHPPAWMINRKVTRPVTLGGFAFPPGAQVAFSPHLMHRDERWWADPDRFDPMRWLGATPPHARHAYAPFGGGPRYCVGDRLVVIQLVLFVAELATRYRLNLPSLDRVRTKYGVLLRPDGVRGSWSPLSPVSP